MSSASPPSPRTSDYKWFSNHYDKESHNWSGEETYYSLPYTDQDPPTTVIVDTIEREFLKSARPFVCNGVIPLKDLGGLSLYYASADGNGNELNRIMFPAADSEALKVCDAGRPSVFGRGQANVYDESYRKARELLAPNFALSKDPVLEAALLPHIQKHLAHDLPLRARLYKLNIYPTGGFFKAHRDTPRSQTHLGTLTLCLPTSFKGGELVVRKDSRSFTFDWAKDVKTEVSSASDTAAVAWTFLYSDCDHEVLPVTEGTRLTVAYDIFSMTELSDADEAEDPSVAVLGDLLLSAYRNRSFLPDGGVLGFGLRHAYPAVFKDESTGVKLEDMMGQLKGGDQVWLHALQQLGLQVKPCGIYNFEFDDYREEDEMEEDDSEGEADDSTKEHSDKKEGRVRYLYKGRDLLAKTGTLHFLDGAHFGEYESVNVSADRSFGTENVIWVTLPGERSGENRYTTYGNDYDADCTYVQMGLTVNIPPVSERDLPPETEDEKAQRLAAVEEQVTHDEMQRRQQLEEQAARDKRREEKLQKEREERERQWKKEQEERERKRKEQRQKEREEWAKEQEEKAKRHRETREERTNKLAELSEQRKHAKDEEI